MSRSRVLLLATLSAIVVATVGAASPVPAAAATTKVTRCDNVNLRTGPNTDHAVKVRLDAGTKVTVVATVSGEAWSATCGDKVRGSSWYRISSVSGVSVHSKYGVSYLYAASGLFKTPSTTSVKQARCDNVNVRTGTRKSSPIKIKLDVGTRVTVVATVRGSSWAADCSGKVSGSTWYRISAIGSTSVKSRFGVSYLYAATGLFKAIPKDPYAADLMRLIQLDRKALGKSPLTVDAWLVALADDLTFKCPTDSSLTVAGRATDMSRRDYFAHTVKSCRKSDGTLYKGSDILVRLFGDTTRRSEIIHWNMYAETSATYKIGCSISGANCVGGSTKTVNRVAIAQRSFMSSSVHRAAELGDYTRFGCGSARTPGTNKTYFACLFTKGLAVP